MRPSSSSGFPFELVFAFIVGITLIVLLWKEEEEARKKAEEEGKVEEAVVVAYATKRAYEKYGSMEEPRKKRAVIQWDHARARDCVHKDYWGGPRPLFNDRMFERVFRVTRTIAQFVLEVCAASDPFFTERTDALGKPGTCPKVKVLTGLKLLALQPIGVSGLFPNGPHNNASVFDKTVQGHSKQQ